ncbi:MAG: hypothetical protein IKD47_06060 [Clostridia bacterium]|nr:hypothetical protein [Clostridia bacterium]
MKTISIKKQWLLALIPMFGVFIVLFCGLFNLKKIKGKLDVSTIGYGFLTLLPLTIFLIVSVAVFGRNVTADNATQVAVTVLLLSTLGAWVSAFVGVWTQKKMLDRASQEQLQNDLG